MRAALLFLAACGSGGTVATPGPSGTVTIESHLDDANDRGVETALFTKTGCPTTTIGDCVMTSPTCLSPLEESAGELAIGLPGWNITLDPDGGGSYGATESTPAPFNGGELITVSAAGLNVPAFTASVTAPKQVVITTPAQAAPVMISRSSDFQVAWTGGGDVRVVLFGATTSSTGAIWSCRLTGGSGSVPAEILQQFSSQPGTMTISSIADSELTAGEYAVTLEATYNAVWPGGHDEVSNSVDFE